VPSCRWRGWCYPQGDALSSQFHYAVIHTSWLATTVLNHWLSGRFAPCASRFLWLLSASASVPRSALALACNLVTFLLFYELLTLPTFPTGGSMRRASVAADGVFTPGDIYPRRRRKLR